MADKLSIILLEKIQLIGNISDFIFIIQHLRYFCYFWANIVNKTKQKTVKYWNLEFSQSYNLTIYILKAIAV